jgi:hypothetical protein
MSSPCEGGIHGSGGVVPEPRAGSAHHAVFVLGETLF